MKKINVTNKENNIFGLVFILNKIGSISGLEQNTAGGFNSLIEKQKKNGWEFLFPGANIDAITAADDIGILAEKSREIQFRCHRYCNQF